jgi:chromosome segregation ATPase
MPSIEERLQALEQEHTELKKTIELQTIAIGALVNKAALEKLNEKYDKIFNALMAHDSFTNQQLAELRGQQIQEDGKIVGLQTEMRQRFNEQDNKFAGLDSRVAGLDSKVAGLDSRVAGLDSKVAGLDSRVAGLDSKVAGLDSRVTDLQTELHQRFSEQNNRIAGLHNKVTESQTTQAEHTILLNQILARLPEQP